MPRCQSQPEFIRMHYRMIERCFDILKIIAFRNLLRTVERVTVGSCPIHPILVPINLVHRLAYHGDVVRGSPMRVNIREGHKVSTRREAPVGMTLPRVRRCTRNDHRTVLVRIRAGARPCTANRPPGARSPKRVEMLIAGSRVPIISPSGRKPCTLPLVDPHGQSPDKNHQPAAAPSLDP